MRPPRSQSPSLRGQSIARLNVNNGRTQPLREEPLGVAKDTDKELVRLVQKGDRRAFDLLFSRYQHKIHGLVSRYVRAHDDRRVVQGSSRRIACRAFAARCVLYVALSHTINTAKIAWSPAVGVLPMSTSMQRMQNISMAAIAARQRKSENSLTRDELEQAINSAISRCPRSAQRRNTSRIRWSKLRTNCEIMDCQWVRCVRDFRAAKPSTTASVH
jgi:RNA polymerase sigma-70 factor (ECF subfamily)